MEAKIARKKIEEDTKLLENRIALLENEEKRALKKIEETKKKANNINSYKERNKEKNVQKQAVDIYFNFLFLFYLIFQCGNFYLKVLIIVLNYNFQRKKEDLQELGQRAHFIKDFKEKNQTQLVENKKQFHQRLLTEVQSLKHFKQVKYIIIKKNMKKREKKSKLFFILY